MISCVAGNLNFALNFEPWKTSDSSSPSTVVVLYLKSDVRPPSPSEVFADQSVYWNAPDLITFSLSPAGNANPAGITERST